MEKVKWVLSVILFFRISLAEAQSSDFIRSGLIRSQLTLSPSCLLNERQQYFYLHGTLEVYTEKNISVAGDSYIFLNTLTNSQSRYEYNHSTFFGMNYHFVNHLSDFYVGIQPGCSFTKLSSGNNSSLIIEPAVPVVTHAGVNPLLSIAVGYNCYIHKYFNLFLQARFVTGQHSYDIQQQLTDLRFSAGLGFNVNTMKDSR